VPGRAINVGELEGIVGLSHGYQTGDEKLSHRNISDVDNIWVPKEKDASSGADSRPLRVAPETMPSKKSRREVINVLQFGFLDGNNVTGSGHNYFVNSRLPALFIEATGTVA
jgi:hypothetical protein